MNRWIPTFLVLSSIAAAAQQPGSNASATRVGRPAVPTWKQIEADTRQRWIRQRPTETIVSVEKIGQPKFTDQPGKPKTPGDLSPASVWAWTWNEPQWSATTEGREGAYMRQMMRVVVNRAGSTRARLDVAAMYRLVGSAWLFAEIPVRTTVSPPRPASSTP